MAFFKFIHMEASINCWYTDTLGVGVAISVGGSPIGPSSGWAALRASTTRVDPPPAQAAASAAAQRERGGGATNRKFSGHPTLNLAHPE